MKPYLRASPSRRLDEVGFKAAQRRHEVGLDIEARAHAAGAGARGAAVTPERLGHEQLHGKLPVNNWDLVFGGGAGEPFNPRTVWTDFRRKLAAAQLPSIKVPRHAARDCIAASARRGARADSPEILGHSSIGLTLGTYSHVLPGVRETGVRAQTAMLGR